MQAATFLPTASITDPLPARAFSATQTNTLVFLARRTFVVAALVLIALFFRINLFLFIDAHCEGGIHQYWIIANVAEYSS